VTAPNDLFFTCQCCFEDEKLENASKRGIHHRVPIDCRTEEWYRRIVDIHFDMIKHPEKLMQRYGEIMEERAEVDLYGYRT